MGVLACCGIIPVLGVLCSLGGLACWILYWVKVAGYSSKPATVTTLSRNAILSCPDQATAGRDVSD